MTVVRNGTDIKNLEVISSSTHSQSKRHARRSPFSDTSLMGRHRRAANTTQSTKKADPSTTPQTTTKKTVEPPKSTKGVTEKTEIKGAVALKPDEGRTIVTEIPMRRVQNTSVEGYTVYVGRH